ncbi:Putative gamma-glutamyltransferase YwrD [Defluviimonas aquaemixtae]|uniref:Gamma-glutamyltransferase YwrD n=1 Tax=Albidovulum aquaemixtae TaxID=1542388 RepID=A0A2R8BL69_9RHOB|nr:gamma-glutamyltransferase family protein [Defluviimonas aquaemixtae]SPH24136.1 Putative gamma-glutamyltransferase YwrD [Defluviimonas aquaemixtae]
MRDFQLPGRSPLLAQNAICATSHPLAAKTAIDILQAGGNAVDAAIAGAVLLGFAEPQSCGIGGDCFALVKPAGEERILALNGSGRAPAGFSAEALREVGATTIGTESVHSATLPGAIDAFCHLSKDLGRLALAECLAPAIRYAEDGIPVAPRVAFDWPENGARLTGAARRFYMNADRPLRTGDIFRAPEQAEVLRRIAAEGRAGFYEGEVAEDMVRSLRAAGGSHTLDDFAAVACDWVDPIQGDYRSHALFEHPPNGQGATAILMLKILAELDLESLDPLGPERAHLEIEAAKLSYDARDRFIADPAHVTRLDHMLADDTARRLAALISPDRVLPDARAASEAVHRDTIYLAVVDRDGMAVSMIYSTYWGFGSGIASDRFGVLFQNRGAGFTLEPGHPNEAGPGKRPMHTIIPAMLCRAGALVMPFGVMGGAYQPAGHAHVVSNLLDFGMDPQEALDAPRCFPDAGAVRLERGYPEATRARLAALGHRVETPNKPLGGGQAILIDHDRGVLWGASDPRKDGCALGY